MIVRKTYKADIDRLRPRIFLCALLGVTAFFFLCLNISFPDNPLALIDDSDDDVSIDMELAAPMEDQHNVVAAEVKKKPDVTDQIRKVDEVKETPAEQLKQELKFATSEADDDDQMKESDLEPIAPAITDMNNNEVPLRVVEQLPEFPGGMVEFMKWLTHVLHYPARARQLKQQGTVKISFVVEKDGSISNIKFVQQTHTTLDAEALRVVRLMPKWKPGKNKGKPCRSVVAVPFVFAL